MPQRRGRGLHALVPEPRGGRGASHAQEEGGGRGGVGRRAARSRTAWAAAAASAAASTARAGGAAARAAAVAVSKRSVAFLLSQPYGSRPPSSAVVVVAAGHALRRGRTHAADWPSSLGPRRDPRRREPGDRRGRQHEQNANGARVPFLSPPVLRSTATDVSGTDTAKGATTRCECARFQARAPRAPDMHPELARPRRAGLLRCARFLSLSDCALLAGCTSRRPRLAPPLPLLRLRARRLIYSSLRSTEAKSSLKCSCSTREIAPLGAWCG